MSRHSREGMVRGAQEHAAQAHEVARDREIDHLPAAVGQQLVGARPALLQDERVVTLLALVDDLGVRRDRAPPRLELGKARQLVRLQRQKPLQLLHQRARARCHGNFFLTMSRDPAAVLPICCSECADTRRHGDYYSRLVWYRSQRASLSCATTW